MKVMKHKALDELNILRKGLSCMATMLSVKELPPNEQVRMSVAEAGKKYSGHFIFFTNSESRLEDVLWVEYGIPYTCSAFMAEDQIPPLLSF